MKSKTSKLLNELIELHPKYIDLSLDRLKKLLEKIGDPHLDLPKTIHIAGTNGKGSVLSFIRNILILNGYSCDAYISPHLTKFNERIILNNKEVSESKLYKTLQYIKRINNNNEITFFEITTAAAFFLFQRSKSDFLILETGLGGRLDATNIIPKKLCSIITPISFDHQEFLGNTIKQITNEKLGIVKNNKFTIISKQKPLVIKYIKNKLKKQNNIFFYNKEYKIKKILDKNFEFEIDKKKLVIKKPKLNGSHQIENASVAIAFAKIIKNYETKVNLNKLSKAIKNTTWPGRLEILKFNDKKIILDGSHNIDGSIKLVNFLKKNKIKAITIFGMLKNKKIKSFLNTIKKQINKILAVSIPEEKNAFTSNDINEVCNSLSIDCIQKKNINEVLKYILKSKENVFLVTGSLYLVGKIRKKFL